MARLTTGWVRTFAPDGTGIKYTPFAQKALTLESPDYFGTEQLDAERMSFTELKRYIAELKLSGFDVVPFTVALHRKVSFPFVALVMTLIAIPFAVTTGRRGALSGLAWGCCWRFRTGGCLRCSRRSEARACWRPRSRRGRRTSCSSRPPPTCC